MLLETEPGDTQVLTTIRLEYDKNTLAESRGGKATGMPFLQGANLEDLEFGYACSFHSKGMGKDSRGSHELYLRYNISSCIFKSARQPHKASGFCREVIWRKAKSFTTRMILQICCIKVM